MRSKRRVAKPAKDRYRQSTAMLERALKSIPLGTQTYSKSKTQYPLGVSPFYVTHGRGSNVWDVDGNKYIDFINALAAITLGYNHAAVMSAVRRQLSSGTIFSLPHPLEIEVSELIIEMVPCAEKVRFGKNGSDATAGAIRAARAYTQRDHVAICGYHGWQDWYIGSTSRNRGVPPAVSALTHRFKYNDLDALHALFNEYPGQIAAVIMEPMNVAWPEKGYLESVKAMTHQNGALLIFDETITGFRLANGGAQELFGVTPDFAAFGKGLSNGYPLSAVAGSDKVMALFEDVFFSFTYGGETLSLAAAKATLTELKHKPILKRMAATGQRLTDGVKSRIAEYGLTDVLSISGHPSWTFLSFKNTPEYSEWEIKTYFLQEMFARGILMLNTHNLSHAHSSSDINYLLDCYSQILPLIKDALDRHSLVQKLRCTSLQPLFKLR